ncbi:MAG TPA: VOC family protein [Acidimicrobiia bacterium]|nr:VOC family protein [Acidimicrobiia bacterium]
MGVRLDQVNLVVRDTDASASFYERLGVRFETAGPAAWRPHHRNGTVDEGAHVDLDSPAFASVWAGGWPDEPGTVLVFRTDTREEVDDLYAELTAAGHPGRRPPWDAFWGARFALVSDPDGNAVGIMSPVDGAHRSAPPDPSTFA